MTADPTDLDAHAHEREDHRDQAAVDASKERRLDAADRARDIRDALRDWRAIDMFHGTEDRGCYAGCTKGHDALLRLRDVADRDAGLGIGGGS